MANPASQGSSGPPARANPAALRNVRPSTAIFTDGRLRAAIQLTAEEELQIDNLDDPRKRLVLHAFCTAGTKIGACDMVKDPQRPGKNLVSVSAVDYWRKNDPIFREMWDAIDSAVNARWEQRAMEGADAGLREDIYDGDGKLKQTRVRQDSSLLQTVLKARNPSYREKNSDGVNITVVIERTDE